MGPTWLSMERPAHSGYSMIAFLFSNLFCVLVLDVQASALDPEGPVSITVDLGGEKKLSAAEIQWEFPAKAFSITTSTDGVKWSEVFATDSNVLSSTTIALGSASASKVRIVMHEARHTLARCRSVDIMYLYGAPKRFLFIY